MKTKLYVSIVLMMTSYCVNAQTFCNTSSKSNYQLLNKMMQSPTVSDTTYCLKVYMHVIRNTDGTGGQTVNSVNQAFEILNQDFNPYDITFSWDFTIDFMDNTTYFNYPYFDADSNDIADIFSINNHEDGIDIYLFDASIGASGRANGVGNSSEFLVTGNWASPYQALITTSVISHEMGHVLFLWHTHRGNYGGGVSSCAELVNGSNSDVCGDYVVDIPSDPYLGFNVDSSCEWLGSGVDANGDSYMPDEENIMSYSIPQCMSYFSPLQGIRMKNSIQTLPHLQQALVDCCNGNEDLDLYIKDTIVDFGIEPSTAAYLWKSPDIWVRNNNDNELIHQNPQYSITNSNYVNVRVRNRSCVSSTFSDSLKLYWAKSNLGLGWPNNWNGSYQNGVLVGDQIGAISIPVLGAGEDTIVKFPWSVPNPVDYEGINPAPWHFCLLARIESNTDTMSTPSSGSIKDNNNMASKNITIVDFVPGIIGPIGAVVGVQNPFDDERIFSIEFATESKDNGKAIFEEAEVSFEMDNVLFDAWKRGGQKGVLLEETRDENTKIIKGNKAIIGNIILAANEMGTLNLSFNFLTKELTNKTNFVYSLVFKDVITGEIIGGETYEINKEVRTAFEAEAGEDIEIEKGDNIILSAEQIFEAAIYNWYDMDGVLIHQGKDFSVAVTVGKKYKLEIIAEADGYKDYDEIEVKLKPSSIANITPNPSSDIITVQCKLNAISSAYLMIIGSTNGASNNYILNIDLAETTINVSNYQLGFYTVVLVCDGQIVDAKPLLKQ